MNSGIVWLINGDPCWHAAASSSVLTGVDSEFAAGADVGEMGTGDIRELAASFATAPTIALAHIKRRFDNAPGQSYDEALEYEVALQGADDVDRGLQERHYRVQGNGQAALSRGVTMAMTMIHAEFRR